MTIFQRRLSTSSLIKIIIGIFFLFFVILPILSMFGRITSTSLASVFTSSQFSKALKNSLTTTFVATLISMTIGLVAAWSIERTAMRYKALFSTIIVLPMLIPSISHAFGLVALFGANGIVTRFFGLANGIYGFWGIVAGSVMYSFPVAYLMFTSILHYEDAMPHKAALVLGIPPLRRFVGITLPYLRKTFIAVFFAVFTMIITDYGVPLMIGGKTTTLSVLMYNKAVGMIDYSSGSVIGVLLLIPAIVAFLVDILNPEKGESGFVSELMESTNNRLALVASYVFNGAVLLAVLAPIVSFCIMVFQTKYPINTEFTLYHIEKTLNRGAGRYLINSIIYAFSAAVFGTSLAFVCSYMTSRMKGQLSYILHLISLTSMAIPGIVLGLSYVIFFSGTNIYGTLLIIALVNSVHFFASPYLMMYNALEKLNPNLEAVGMSLGIKRIRIVFDVIIPKVKSSLSEMFTYFFVNSMMTISAVSFLAPPAPKPVSLMINQFEAQLLMESAAFVSLLILLINLLTKGGFALAKKKFN